MFFNEGDQVRVIDWSYASDAFGNSPTTIDAGGVYEIIDFGRFPTEMNSHHLFHMPRPKTNNVLLAHVKTKQAIYTHTRFLKKTKKGGKNE